MVKVNRMIRKKLKTTKQLQKEHIDVAMQEFFSRGGRIKKINPFGKNNTVKDDNEDYNDDYSWIESTSPIALRKSH